MLASFRIQLETIRFAIMGAVVDKYETKRDDPNEQKADIADGAVQSYNKKIILELGEQKWKKLQLVEEALEKMDNEQYAICLECREPIPEERLKVIPFAVYCIPCLESIEKAK